MRVSPCKECVPPRRSITCHTECDEYNKWKKERDEINKNKSIIKQNTNILLKYAKKYN